MPYDTPMILVFWCQRSRRHSNGFTPMGRQIEVGQATIGDFRRISRSAYISEIVQDRDIVTMEGL